MVDKSEFFLIKKRKKKRKKELIKTLLNILNFFGIAAYFLTVILTFLLAFL